MSLKLRTSRIFVLPIVFCALTRASAEVDEPAGAPAPPAEVVTEAQVTGATLTSTPIELPRRRSARGELELLQQAQARLVVTRPISFRTTRLPAGDYAVRVEHEDGDDKAYYLVVESKPAPSNAPAQELEETSTTQKATRRARGSRGVLVENVEDAVGRGALEEDVKENVKPRDSKLAPRPKDSDSTRDKDVKKNPEKSVELPRLRVPMKLTACERKGDQAAFELALRARGTKLRITFRAGETAAQATLRLGDRK